jgi:hypothetical protein
MSEPSEVQPTKKMTDEERLELAAKLDKDLDVFMDSLEKRRYTEGWPEDRWQEVTILTIFIILFNHRKIFRTGNGQTSFFHEKSP